LPDNLSVRIYPIDACAFESDPEESESGHPTDDESSAEMEDQKDIKDRWKQNKAFCDAEINKEGWEVQDRDCKTAQGELVALIIKPTVSKMSHQMLNPFIYRNIKNVGSLNDLAKLLQAPDDWESKYNDIMKDNFLQRKLVKFSQLDVNTLESNIQAAFNDIVSCVAKSLQIIMMPQSESPVIVGGFLAGHKYDVRSRCDPNFLDEDGNCLIASEVKTARTFQEQDMWYHKMRGLQVLSALYAFNAPTFLLNQKRWKLFVENEQRNDILTFPYNDDPQYSAHVKSSLVRSMGRTFLQAIVICLLSKRHAVSSMTDTSTKESVTVMQTPDHQMVKKMHFDTSKKPVEASDRQLRSSSSIQGKKTASFISGYVDGKPVYSVVRVLSRELVAQIEDEIDQKAQFEKSDVQVLTDISESERAQESTEKWNSKKSDSELTLGDQNLDS
jgi:hypothetical protein